jgi:hypothetical protein
LFAAIGRLLDRTLGLLVKILALALFVTLYAIGRGTPRARTSARSDRTPRYD